MLPDLTNFGSGETNFLLLHCTKVVKLLTTLVHKKLSKKEMEMSLQQRNNSLLTKSTRVTQPYNGISYWRMQV